MTTPEGFFGFWDQSQYFLETKLLASWHLPAVASEYYYGLGYPAAAVPFYWLGFHGDPFAPLDVLLFATTVVGTAVIGARILGNRAGLVAAILAAVATPLLGLATVPWNSTLVTAAFMLALVLATGRTPMRTPDAAILGLLSGLAFAARYVDVVAFVALAVWALARSPRSQIPRLVVAFSIPAGLLLVMVLYSHAQALGSPLTTPYASHVRSDGTSDQSLGQYDLARVPRHAWEVGVSGTADGRREPRSPLLRVSPFFVLAPVGVVALVRQRTNRSLAVLLTLLSIAVTVFYLSFIAGGGGDLKFGNLRYWAMWYPWWTILSVAGAMAVFGPPRTDESASHALGIA